MKERIKLEDTPKDIVMKMCEGNPGALTVLMSMLRDGGSIDPDDFMQGIGAVLALDSNNIYGSRIWMLHKDVCKGNLPKTIGMLRGWQLGLVSEAALSHAIDNYGDGVDVDGVVQKVKERLPNFNLDFGVA